jgi:hypothetical protein
VVGMWWLSGWGCVSSVIGDVVAQWWGCGGSVAGDVVAQSSGMWWFSGKVHWVSSDCYAAVPSSNPTSFTVS